VVPPRAQLHSGRQPDLMVTQVLLAQPACSKCRPQQNPARAQQPAPSRCCVVLLPPIRASLAHSLCAGCWSCASSATTMERCWRARCPAQTLCWCPACPAPRRRCGSAAAGSVGLLQGLPQAARLGRTSIDCGSCCLLAAAADLPGLSLPQASPPARLSSSLSADFPAKLVLFYLHRTASTS